MKRELRNRVAAALGGLLPASFGTHLWLFFFYVAYRPKVPNPELGLVHPLNDHGSYVFISGAESTGLTLLTYIFFAAIVLSLVIVPKDFLLPPPGTPRWITWISGRAKTDLARPSRSLKLIFFASIAFWTALIWLVGAAAVGFVNSHGIVLNA